MIRECAHLPVRCWQAWLGLLCVLALAAACTPASANVATTAPTSPPIAAMPAMRVPTALPAASSTATGAPTSLPTTSSAVTRTPPPPPTVSSSAQENTPVYGYRVVNEYPHDPEAFTQGLVYEDGILYEGTGLTLGRSSLRKVALETGEVLQITSLESEFFGEGISVVGDRIWQLTYQNHVAFLYDKETFEPLDTVRYATEGWGLTYDGERLIMSDGTATLYFRDPNTFELLGQVPVRDEQGPVVKLNELEYIDGLIYANIWQTDRIAIINPASGQVVAWIDLGGLLQLEDPAQAVDVLNGIAYDTANERLFVTGKWWPKLFEIELVAGTVYLPLIARP